MSDNEHRKPNWEVIITAVLAAIAWAYTAGTLSQRIEDVDRDVQQIKTELQTINQHILNHMQEQKHDK